MTAPDPAAQTTEQQAPAQETTETPPAQETTQTDQSKQTDWVAEARKWEERAKENKKTAEANAAAAKELERLKQERMTEQERLQSRAEAAERRVQELEEAEQRRNAEAELNKQIEGWKDKVSKDTNVPATVLRGSTLEEIKAHAESLKELFPDERRGAYVPSEGRHTGPAGSGGPRDDFIRAIQTT